MMADKGCAERGCPMHESGDEFVEMVPKREWVGLTQEEFEKVTKGLEDLEDCWIAIEAKLKEKNS